MALTRIKNWITGEILQAGDLNSEFDSLINSALSLISPLTGNLDFNGFSGLNFGVSVGGFRAAITHAATANRTITIPDATGTLVLTSNNLSVFAATTSAQLAGVISDETGSGLLVFGTSPTLVTPTIAATGWTNATHTHVAANTGGILTPVSATADVTTSETTTSTSFTNLATSGPAITLTPGSTGTHLLIIKAEIGNNTSGEEATMSVAIGGATAVAVDGAKAAADSANNVSRSESSIILAASQTSGATHTAKYNVSTGTGTFKNRRITGHAMSTG